MSIDVLMLVNNEEQATGAVANVMERFGVEPKLLRGAKAIAEGYNQLAKQSTADILCFMHQDVRFDFPLKAIYDYFKGLPKVGVLGFCGTAKQIPGKQWWECQPIYGALTQGEGANAKPLTFNSPTRFMPTGKHGYQPVQTVDGYCLFVKREVFEKMGGFDMAYKNWHGYDIDICSKALALGLQNYVIQQPSTHFSWGGSGETLNEALTLFKEKWDMMYSKLNPAPELTERTLKAPSRSSKGRLKICVYTICKNEIQFAERFAKSCEDADGVYVLDTGSTDGTPEALAKFGVTVQVKPYDSWKTLEEYDKLTAEGKNPWRFDLARNISMDMCPEDADVLVCIDLDEVLVPGWRKIIEDAWTPVVNHLSYLFAWSMTAPYPEGEPHNCFWYEKIHSRHGYLWAQAVHEQLCSEAGFQDVRAWVKTCLVKHYSDPSKSRAQYLNLLELAVREAPHAVLSRFYYGRELSFKSRFDDCIASHKFLLSMPECDDARTRGNACSQIAACYGAKKNVKEQFNWLIKAVTETPNQREAWVELAYFCQITGDNLLGYWAAKKALSIPESACDNNYLVDPDAWKHKPHDIAAITGWHAFNANQREEAMQDAWEALRYSPWNDHFADNYRVSQNCLAKPYVKTPAIVDVVILSYSKTEKEYNMTKAAIQSLRASSPDVGMQFVVVETNTQLANEKFVDKEMFGPDVDVIFPPGPFGFNKFLNCGYGTLCEISSPAKYIVVMNNDVVLFNPGFVSYMLEGMKSVSSASPLGLREATWGLVNRNVPIDENYDINKAVNGWFLMFDKRILNALPFEKLFDPKFTWYHGDVFYAKELERCGYKHGMINAAQALHLQKQSHPLRKVEAPTGVTGALALGDAVGPTGPADRTQMLSMLSLKGKRCVEVGVDRGEYSKQILANDPKSLHLIDPWCHQDKSVYPDPLNVSNDEAEKVFRSVQDTLGKDQRVSIRRSFSVDAVKTFDDDSLDFVYIDAIHTKKACLEDMQVWWPKVASGGWMCGHDYQCTEVQDAVCKFFGDNNLKLTFATKEGAPSWAIQK